jgi:glycosyltransferase involved in cell wall biosynthesis
MDKQPEISVIITTFNRCELLAQALEALLAQQAAAVRFEIIVVDNHSTDRTREVVESFMRRGEAQLQYLFEAKKGISYGRNAGILKARAEIVAFTDDDVRVAPDWLATLKQSFAEHPEADFIGGKILPEWSSGPPPWLTRNHWWPLALLDYGDEPFCVNADNPLCLPTANAAFRRRLFEQVGLFSPDFSGREDHELLLRLWRAKFQGLYIPGLRATAQVQPERLKKQYHHHWNRTTGKFNSRMGLDEMMTPQGGLKEVGSDMLRLFGTPLFLYRNLLVTAVCWVWAAARRRESLTLQYENRIHYLFGYMGERYRSHGKLQTPPKIVEICILAKNLLRKKLLAMRASK